NRRGRSVVVIKRSAVGRVPDVRNVTPVGCLKRVGSVISSGSQIVPGAIWLDQHEAVPRNLIRIGVSVVIDDAAESKREAGAWPALNRVEHEYSSVSVRIIISAPGVAVVISHQACAQASSTKTHQRYWQLEVGLRHHRTEPCFFERGKGRSAHRVYRRSVAVITNRVSLR